MKPNTYIVRKRLDQLLKISQERLLTLEEVREMRECVKLINGEDWKEAKYFNLMYAARVAKDWKWFDEVSEDYRAWVRG